MNMLKLTAAAALVAASLSASAMTTINDEELSTVAGQDGVSIAANLNINIGSFVYTDTDVGDATKGGFGGGGSVSFNNISIKGLMEMNIDIVNAATFKGTLAAVGASAGASYDGVSDVVQFAFPADTNAGAIGTPSIKVGSITLGNAAANADGTAKSFGSVAINNLDLRGTTVWMWAH
ncbi:DUF6160 family protein [Scleromatobacter humisilvae]|uniref:DUF6160 domain-containing protein n=1 Tax=Scleromatobacter humisilvae TaxID=2897159 RepID=A0A9X1YJV2_9BURK|nr:DUF6160 family protein [Scleromatobacter humisilvae]MCK9687236.1 hypothetical protein [Scleromatobacter humisilvae]